GESVASLQSAVATTQSLKFALRLYTLFPYCLITPYLYTFIPSYLYTSIPLYLYTSIPIHLYTYTPIYSYTYILIPSSPSPFGNPETIENRRRITDAEIPADRQFHHGRN